MTKSKDTLLFPGERGKRGNILPITMDRGHVDAYESGQRGPGQSLQFAKWAEKLVSKKLVGRPSLGCPLNSGVGRLQGAQFEPMGEQLRR